jgi:glutathione S-transferase
LPAAQREKKAEADVASVAQILGDREFFHGRPSTIDATAYAFLANATWTPVQGVVGPVVAKHPSLLAYIERIRDRWFSQTPPRKTGESE